MKNLVKKDQQEQLVNTSEKAVKKEINTEELKAVSGGSSNYRGQNPDF